MPTSAYLEEWAHAEVPPHTEWKPRTFQGEPVVAVEPMEYLRCGPKAVRWTKKREAHYGLSWTPSILKDEARRLQEATTRYVYSWEGFTETHRTPRAFKSEHPEIAGLMLDIMREFGLERVSYKHDGHVVIQVLS